MFFEHMNILAKIILKFNLNHNNLIIQFENYFIFTIL